jgi:hypothetical protein
MFPHYGFAQCKPAQYFTLRSLRPASNRAGYHQNAKNRFRQRMRSNFRMYFNNMDFDQLTNKYRF